MKKLTIVLLMAGTLSASAQTVNEFLKEARTLSEQKDYESALDVISKGLDVHLGDGDLEIYKARVLLWKGDFFNTEKELYKLLADYPESHEVHLLNNNLYLWQEEWDNLLDASNAALEYFSDDEVFITRKVIALKNQKNYKEALVASKSIGKKSAPLMAIIDEIKMFNHQQVGLGVVHSQFSNTFKPWTTGKIEYQNVSKNSFNVAATYASMFNQSGTSLNAEYYPRLSKRLSGFFEAGASPSVILPQYRLGAEVIMEAGKMEFSGGTKFLKFKDQADVITMATVGLGWYYNKFYSNLKGYLTTIESTQSTTGSLLVRRTFKNRYHYLQINLSQGATPLQINNFSEISRINSTTILLSYSHYFSEGYVILVSTGTQNESYAEGMNRRRYTAGLTISKQF